MQIDSYNLSPAPNTDRLCPYQLDRLSREGLNKCLLHFSDAQGESALSALLTFSVTYSHRKWWHIPVPREPLINQRFPSGLVLRGEKARQPSFEIFEYLPGPECTRVNIEAPQKCGDIRLCYFALLLNVTGDGLNQWSLTDCGSDTFTELWLVHSRCDAYLLEVFAHRLQRYPTDIGTTVSRTF